MSEKKERNKKNGKQTGLALACWILGFLILLIVFLVKRDDIYTNLKTTQFFERVFKTTPSFIENYEVKEDKAAKNDSEVSGSEEEFIDLSKLISKNESTSQGSLSDGPQKENTPATERTSVAEENSPSTANSTAERNNSVNETKSDSTNVVSVKEENSQAVASAKAETEKPAKPEKSVEKSIVQTSKQKIYFVKIYDDGIVSRQECMRVVEKNSSPLTTNLKLLLEGPTAEERAKGVKTLIPENTKLLSASVRDGVAYINFSEDFEINRIGIDGYKGQLMQIVYTATEFSTVNSVQFIIEGEKKEFLGSEGLRIGIPLSRSSF